jgi:hypothetical protein
MLIAQAFVEYGLVAALIEGMYRLRVYAYQALGNRPELALAGIAVALVVGLKLIRR